MSNIPKLVAIYAANTIQTIEETPALLEAAFGNPPAVLSKDQDFSRERELVERLKRIVEAIDQDPDIGTVKVQISKSLKALFRLVRFEKGAPEAIAQRMDVLRDLIVARYATKGRWDAPQRAHFDFVFERLKEWNTYFLSYTNHGGSDVNARFRDVIDRYTEPEVLAARDAKKHNILADAVVNRLRKRLGNRRSFYDKENITVGMNIAATIAPATSKTFAFVQLIQVETFDTTESVNWSWEEYQQFHTSNELELKQRKEYRDVFYSRFAPVLTASRTMLQLSDPPWDYDLWTKRVFTDAHFMELPNGPEAFDQKMLELSDVIVNLTHKIIDNIP